MRGSEVKDRKTGKETWKSAKKGREGMWKRRQARRENMKQWRKKINGKRWRGDRKGGGRVEGGFRGKRRG